MFCFGRDHILLNVGFNDDIDTLLFHCWSADHVVYNTMEKFRWWFTLNAYLRQNSLLLHQQLLFQNKKKVDKGEKEQWEEGSSKKERMNRVM